MQNFAIKRLQEVTYAVFIKSANASTRDHLVNQLEGGWLVEFKFLVDHKILVGDRLLVLVKNLKLRGPKLQPLVLEMLNQDSPEVEMCALITEEILLQHQGGHYVNHRQIMLRKRYRFFIKIKLDLNLGIESENHLFSVRQIHKHALLQSI